LLACYFLLLCSKIYEIHMLNECVNDLMN